MGIPVRPTVDPGRTGAMLSVDSQLLRSVRLRARKSGHRHLVRLASTTASPLRSIAVLGAGLAGLSHALFLARGLRQDDNGKKHRIVVYDAAERTGGWVQSERQPLPRSSQEIEAGVPQETALLEAGPRSVRAAGLGGVSMIELIASLNLADGLISVSKQHPSAVNRFLYHGGKLHLMPPDPVTAIRCWFDKTHPVRKSRLDQVMNVFYAIDRKPISKWHDESIEDFSTRLFGGRDQKEGKQTLPLIDYGMSAMLHGIYASDASRLSVRSIFPLLFIPAQTLFQDKESKLPWPFNVKFKTLDMLADEGEEWAKLEVRKAKREASEYRQFGKRLGKEVMQKMSETSVVSFDNGIQTLTDAIQRECQEKGVEFRLGSKIQSLTLENGKATIKAEGGRNTFDRVVAALPSNHFASLLSNVKLPNLSANPMATVCVVNVAVPSSFNLQIPPAFGFLLPRACAQEGDNDLGLLGVVFDSQAVPGQDDCTKLTMMFGGPYWKPGFAMYDSVNSGPDGEKKALDIAVQQLAFFFGASDPTIFQSPQILKRLRIQRDCIPTYTPGHLGRMDELHQALQRSDALPLSVIGASYTGVSMNDIVLNARRTANRIIKAERGSGAVSVTGLEELVEE